jgi:DNA replication and repair protein RecF
MTITRLSLTDFRNHTAADFRPHPSFVILQGTNGAGKTNVLEAVSLLVPGRGLRGAAMAEMPNMIGTGGFSIAAELDDVNLGVGVDAHAPDRRKVRINGSNASMAALAEWLSIIWLTPAMDRIFADSAGGRRRFLDRLVLALEPSHANVSARYEQALRHRNKLLSGDVPVDQGWIAGLEDVMASTGAVINTNRNYMLELLSARLAQLPGSPFAVPRIALDSPAPQHAEALANIWRANRPRETSAGRTLFGPHRADLIVHHASTGQAAFRCSTGEQKALLLSVILTHAQLIDEQRGAPPIILLDEVAAHLDPARREALFLRLDQIGGQVWMTGTERSLFHGIGADAQIIEVAGGRLIL